MEYYRAYNVNRGGETISFKGFPAESDRDACMQALSLSEEGKWHAMELWTGTDKLDCSEMASERRARRILLPAEQNWPDSNIERASL